MAEQFDNSGFTHDDNISELRRQISLSSALMVDLVSDDDKFTHKLKALNDSGLSFIQQEEYQTALIYLQEAEKILQYAASCGKTIDRSIIISTLQNEACVYQRLWELQKASNYLEAIIFNMNAYLECTPDVSIDEQIFDIHSSSYAELSIFVKKRINMAFYYLQFSAVSSQNKKHDIALGSAFKALSILKMICEQCYNFQKYIRKDEKVTEGTSSILKELSHLKETVEVDKIEKYLLLAKRGITKLRMKSQQNKIIEELSNFAIGEVMQISPIDMEELVKKPKIKDEVTFIQKIFKAIYISICFFTIATELRLIAAENYLDSEIETSPQFKKSQIFHLNSIIIASKYVPCETRYLQHIIKSFSLHYKIDLLEGSESENQKEKDEEDFGGNGLLVQGPQNGHSLTLSAKKLKDKAEPDTQDIESPTMIKKSTSKHDITTKLHTQNFSSEKSLQHRSPSYQLKRKKKHSRGNPEHKKSKISAFNPHNPPHKEAVKEIFGPTFVKNTSFGDGRRKSSINKKVSEEKLKFLMPPKNRSNRNTKEKQLKFKEKSRDKSKSQSRNKVSIEKNHLKQKSTDKIRKKNHKLSEEYFMKPAGKKKGTNKLKTAISSKSLKKKGNIDEYLSSSRIINNPSHEGGNPHCNTFIGMKKSTIKSPNKVKL